MAKKNQYFEHESLQSTESVIKYLKALTEGIEKGEILLSDEEDTQVITPGDLTTLSIKARNTKKEQSLKIRFCWSQKNDDDPDNAPLFIKAKKPKSNQK